MIGKPPAEQFKNSQHLVREHVQRWRGEKVGQVEWQPVKYQSASTAVEIPVYWCIQTPDEWIAACHDKQAASEYDLLLNIVSNVDVLFHALLIRQRSLWRNLSQQEVVQCCQLAMQLEPGCAAGRPLRALPVANIDSKFIENHRNLLINLMNIRFNDALRDISLESFLGAAINNDHWVLVVPLANNLLPVQELRLRTSELARTDLPCRHLVVIENEQCRHQLPGLENTIAILGAGLNLSWLKNPSFNDKHLAYWGDIDTWGLKMLAMARSHQPDIRVLLMNKETFEQYQYLAVAEPRHVGEESPEELTRSESQLYQQLLQSPAGRLEQEFIPRQTVHLAFQYWHENIAPYRLPKDGIQLNGR